MKLGVLFSGGKDSTLATWIAKEQGHEIVCLMSVLSENEASYMFHTPSISKVKKQAEVMGIPILLEKTLGEKEKELADLEKIIYRAKEKYGIEGVVSGAVGSVYQATRVERICEDLGLKSIAPLWKKDQLDILEMLVNAHFEVTIIGVAAYPLGKDFLGKIINEDFIKEVSELRDKYKISPAGEGGEFESFVLNCPLFERGLRVVNYTDSGEKNSWRRELEIR